MDKYMAPFAFLSVKQRSRKMRKITGSLLLTLAALIWGVAFVAQSSGGAIIGPYTFNSLRFLIGACVLFPIVRSLKRPETCREGRFNLKGGALCGLALFLGTTLQQLGLYYGTGAGKAGFLTACYILLVPILRLFFKKKCGINVWIGVVLATAGLYLLCIDGDFELQLSDGLVLLSALFFSFHILLVDHFSARINEIRLSFLQFLTSGLLGLLPMLFIDMSPANGGLSSWAAPFSVLSAWIPLLYAGVLSSGLAYTLQVVGQKRTDPTIASLIMSLEAAFAVLAGWLLLHERMSPREIAGCLLIFPAILLAQIPASAFRRKKRTPEQRLPDNY